MLSSHPSGDWKTRPKRNLVRIWVDVTPLFEAWQGSPLTQAAQGIFYSSFRTYWLCLVLSCTAISQKWQMPCLHRLQAVSLKLTYFHSDIRPLRAF